MFFRIVEEEYLKIKRIVCDINLDLCGKDESIGIGDRGIYKGYFFNFLYER